MLDFISISLIFVAALLAIPVLVFLLEIAAAILLPKRDHSTSISERPRRRCAVLVPAHNESTELLPTLADVRAQLTAGDRLVVVADNCSDDTAAIAAAAGAEVVERNQPDRKGKGFAVAFGIDHLIHHPPDVVILIDADCRLANDTIEGLTSTCWTTRRPVQSAFSMTTQDDSPVNTRVAEFAWSVKNYVRPRGLANLGLPCQLMGSGMAFPWDVIRATDLASGSIVEDLKLGLDLALAGHPALFCPSFGVASSFPYTAEGIRSQRMRWEGGHIGTIFTIWPHLIVAAISRADFNLFALALDLAVPPLSLLGILAIATTVASSLAILIGVPSTAMWISLANIIALSGAGFLSWLAFGRKILPLAAIVLILPYMFRKFGLYRTIISGTTPSHWVRTDRTK